MTLHTDGIAALREWLRHASQHEGAATFIRQVTRSAPDGAQIGSRPCSGGCGRSLHTTPGRRRDSAHWWCGDPGCDAEKARRDTRRHYRRRHPRARRPRTCSGCGTVLADARRRWCGGEICESAHTAARNRRHRPVTPARNAEIVLAERFRRVAAAAERQTGGELPAGLAARSRRLARLAREIIEAR